jgi:hypothetical protein
MFAAPKGPPVSGEVPETGVAALGGQNVGLSTHDGHAEFVQQRRDAAFDVRSHASYLLERSADRVADAPVLVSSVGGDVDHADAVAHRHDHVGGLQHLVGHRVRECIVGIDAELADYGLHAGVDLPADPGSGGTYGHLSVRQ